MDEKVPHKMGKTTTRSGNMDGLSRGRNTGEAIALTPNNLSGSGKMLDEKENTR